MSMPLGNVDQDDYVPPIPSALPSAPSVELNPGPSPDNNDLGPGQEPTGSAPIPQMPQQYDPPDDDSQQRPYGGCAPQHYGGFEIANLPTTPQSGVLRGPQQMFTSNEWMNMPTDTWKSSAGLEYLTVLDLIIFQESFKWLRSAYDIFNSSGKKVYHLVVGINGYDISVFDRYETRALETKSKISCCTQRLEISAPPLIKIATVQEGIEGCFTMVNKIENQFGEKILLIKDDTSLSGILKDDFISSTGEHLGKISKIWPCFKESFTHSLFGVSFPLDLDVNKKAILLGASFYVVKKYRKRQRHTY